MRVRLVIEPLRFLQNQLRFAAATFGAPRSTRDTVMIDTPVAWAMSLSVGVEVMGMVLA
jgi:hypothetical protein